MSRAMFDLPPTHACSRFRVETRYSSRPMPLNPAERRMILEVKAFDRGITLPPEQRGTLPGSALGNNGGAPGLREAGVSRVLCSRDVIPLNAFEQRLLGQVKPVEDKTLLDSRGVQRGIRRGTERAAARVLNEVAGPRPEPSSGGWEDHDDWVLRMAKENKI